MGLDTNKQKEPIMDERILAELSTLNKLLALAIVVVEQRDVAIPFGHTIDSELLVKAKSLIERINTDINKETY